MVSLELAALRKRVMEEAFETRASTEPSRSDEEAWRDLCEKDDRTSPWADMCLINQEEFNGYMAAARAQGQADERERAAKVEKREADLHKAYAAWLASRAEPPQPRPEDSGQIWDPKFGAPPK